MMPQVSNGQCCLATSIDGSRLARTDSCGMDLFLYRLSFRREEDSLPVWGRDVHVGACQIIEKMKRLNDRQEGAKFVTLAMDANTGATEAFQLSDVSIQMVAEKMWEGTEQGRFVTTQHEIIVDGKETTSARFRLVFGQYSNVESSGFLCRQDYQ